MNCEVCGKEITSSYICFKKVGSQEYLLFHSDNSSDRAASCWALWMIRRCGELLNVTAANAHR